MNSPENLNKLETPLKKQAAIELLKNIANDPLISSSLENPNINTPNENFQTFIVYALTKAIAPNFDKTNGNQLTNQDRLKIFKDELIFAKSQSHEQLIGAINNIDVFGKSSRLPPLETFKKVICTSFDLNESQQQLFFKTSFTDYKTLLDFIKIPDNVRNNLKEIANTPQNKLTDGPQWANHYHKIFSKYDNYPVTINNTQSILLGKLTGHNNDGTISITIDQQNRHIPYTINLKKSAFINYVQCDDKLKLELEKQEAKNQKIAKFNIFKERIWYACIKITNPFAVKIEGDRFFYNPRAPGVRWDRQDHAEETIEGPENKYYKLFKAKMDEYEKKGQKLTTITAEMLEEMTGRKEDALPMIHFDITGKAILQDRHRILAAWELGLFIQCAPQKKLFRND